MNAPFEITFNLTSFIGSLLKFKDPSSKLNLEKILKSQTGHENCILGYKARYLIYLSFKALKARSKKTKVLINNLTLPLIVDAIQLAGCEPVFIDCNTDLQIDFSQLKNKIKDDVLAIYVSHLFGTYQSINFIKNEFPQIYVFEDFCQAFPFPQKIKINSDFCLFSFGFLKDLAFLSGGAVTISDKEIHNIMMINFHKEFHKPSIKVIMLDLVSLVVAKIAIAKWSPLVLKKLIFKKKRKTIKAGDFFWMMDFQSTYLTNKFEKAQSSVLARKNLHLKHDGFYNGYRKISLEKKTSRDFFRPSVECLHFRTGLRDKDFPISLQIANNIFFE